MLVRCRYFKWLPGCLVGYYILNPEFTMGAAPNVLNDKGFDTYENNLLAWQKAEKKRGREGSWADGPGWYIG